MQWSVGLNWYPEEKPGCCWEWCVFCICCEFHASTLKKKRQAETNRKGHEGKQSLLQQNERSLVCLWEWGLGKAMVDHPGHLCFSYGFWRCPEALHGLAQFWLILMACTSGSNLFSYPSEGWAHVHHPGCCGICCTWYFSSLVTELTFLVKRIIWTQLLITVKCGSEAHGGQGHFWFQKLSGYHTGIAHYCRV